MNCLRWIIGGVRRRHRLILISTVCIVLLSCGAFTVQAQDSDPPDLQMLLNLDLFRSQPPQDEPGGRNLNSSGSTLDQIRTLDALGYLSNGMDMDAASDGPGESTKSPVPPPSQETPE